MKANNIICELKPYIQPFERTLALKELRMVSGVKPRLYPSSNGNSYVVRLNRPIEEIIDSLTYWQAVWRTDSKEVVHHTTQVRIEAGHSASRSGAESRDLVLPRKRELRYGP